MIDNANDAYTEIQRLMSKFGIPGKAWHPIDFAEARDSDYDLNDDEYMTRIGNAMDDAYDALSDANDDEWNAINDALDRAFKGYEEG